MHAASRRIPVRTVCVALGLALALAIALVLSGCGGSQPASSSGAQRVGGIGAPSPGGTTVIEQGSAFVPSKVTVKVGDVITFVNQDSVPHEVGIAGGSLGQQAEGQSVRWTAKAKGVVAYTCLVHPSMKGQITVR